jgi:hypothetical protein
MTHVLYRFVKRVTVLVGVLGAVVLGIVVPASASSAGGSLAAGNSMCTDQTGSANGVTLSGAVTTPTTNVAGVTWTVRAARRPGTAEVQIFRSARKDVSNTPLVANLPGTVFYRLCLANNSAGPVSFTHAAVVAGGPATETRTGATTAVLSSGGTVCGERIAKRGHLQATSTAPITWLVRAFSGNGPTATSTRLLTVTSTSVNAFIPSGSYAFLDVCALDRSPDNNTAATTAIAMQFTAN